jgi:hypothetical protein
VEDSLLKQLLARTEAAYQETVAETERYNNSGHHCPFSTTMLSASNAIIAATTTTNEPLHSNQINVNQVRR